MTVMKFKFNTCSFSCDCSKSLKENCSDCPVVQMCEFFGLKSESKQDVDGSKVVYTKRILGAKLTDITEMFNMCKFCQKTPKQR